MADDFVFEDNTIKVNAALDAAIVAALYEAGGEIHAEVVRKSKVGIVRGGQTKNAWELRVDKDTGEAQIGNPLENALWEEYGTGLEADGGKGRKTGWYIKIGNGKGQIPQAVVDAYHMEVVYGKKGVKFAYTEGKKGKHTLRNAFNTKRSIVKRIIEDAIKEGMK